ncbi:hypothetical protein H6H03_39615, partial [Nostoc paludosum FACHB-159]|nr:hypothetical protein [Nostoc sp. FACHB-857]MBD2739872.1 hypothetical protein [Nostoc paludosum FACHB-159]
PSESFYTRIEKRAVNHKPNLREFWLGSKRLPSIIEASNDSGIPAILIKKEGDFPAFWQKDSSFIETMEELYQRVKTKNQNLI